MLPLNAATEKEAGYHANKHLLISPVIRHFVEERARMMHQSGSRCLSPNIISAQVSFMYDSSQRQRNDTAILRFCDCRQHLIKNHFPKIQVPAHVSVSDMASYSSSSKITEIRDEMLAKRDQSVDGYKSVAGPPWGLPN